MSDFQKITLPINDELTIKCCKCYESYWKELKSAAGVYHVFNESIEKNKSIRRFFSEVKVLFHYCFPCLKEVMIKKKIVVVKDSDLIKAKDVFKSIVAESSCIAAVLNQTQDIETICSSCINFMLLRLEYDDCIIPF